LVKRLLISHQPEFNQLATHPRQQREFQSEQNANAWVAVKAQTVAVAGADQQAVAGGLQRAR
jgi:hypothetical protein